MYNKDYISNGIESLVDDIILGEENYNNLSNNFMLICRRDSVVMYSKIEDLENIVCSRNVSMVGGNIYNELEIGIYSEFVVVE